MQRFFAFTLLCFLPLGTVADEFTKSRSTPWYDNSQNKSWWVDLDIGIELEPDYVGSDDYLTEGDIGLSFNYKATEKLQMTLTPQTLGLIFRATDKDLISLTFEAEEGREAGETEDLDLLLDGEDTTEAELTYARRFGADSFAYATFQPEIENGGKGKVYFLGVGRVWQPRPNWLLTARADVSWGDDEHMQTEFGISPDDANLLGVSSYDASGGLKSSTIGVFSEWIVNERWRINAGVEVERYFSEAADSPLLDQLGSKTTYEALLSVSYRW